MTNMEDDNNQQSSDYDEEDDINLATLLGVVPSPDSDDDSDDGLYVAVDLLKCFLTLTILIGLLIQEDITDY